VSPEAWSALATGLGAIVALAAAAVATGQARKANRCAAESASAATRSAAADERAAAAAERATDIAELTFTYRPKWTIRPRAPYAPLYGDGFGLINETGETAFDTVIEPASQGLIQGWRACDIRDGEERFFVALTWPGSDDRITISWRRPNGERRTWHGVLPVRGDP
jgi:hypothetical protein